MNSTHVMDQAIDNVLNAANEKKIALEVLGFERSSTSINFQKAKMDQFAISETRQIGVRVVDGQNEGVAYTESLAPESLDQIIDEAVNNARVIRKEWIAELSPPIQTAALEGLYNPALDQVTVEQKIAAAKKLESAALGFDPRITGVAYSKFGDSRSKQWIANTKGLRASYAMNSCGAYSFCMAKDGSAVVMDGEQLVTRQFDEPQVSQLATTSARKTLARLGSIRPKTGVYTVVFDSRVAETLVRLLSSYFSAKSVDEKTSPLADKLGKKVFSSQFSMVDDPLTLLAWGTRPFDDEGYPSRKTELVKDGTVSRFLTNSVLARKLNLPHTASASRAPSTDLDVSASNILVQPGKMTLEQMTQADSKVIHVTRLMGMAGYRATSGDFSIPLEGFLYENGKLKAPLKDFLMSGNLLQLFADIEEVGSETLPAHGSVVSPPFLVRNINISGQAEETK